MRLLALVLALLLPLGAYGQSLTVVSLSGGRSYLIARPAGDGPVPLILALHGGGGNPQQFARISGLAPKAVQAGFAIAFPAGSSRRNGRMLAWNAGYCCGWAAESGVDDLAYLDGVVADARRQFGATGSLFLTGMSNGAMMSQTYAARRGAAVAGVVSVSGTMDAARLRLVGQVPLLHIHGTGDTMVPIDGGPGDSSLTETNFASVNSVLADFRAPFGTMRQSDKSWTAGGYEFRRTVWTKAGRENVVLITVIGGDHEWPGGGRADNKALDASATAIDFFKAQMR